MAETETDLGAPHAAQHNGGQVSSMMEQLLTGDEVAWVTKANDKTTGLSSVHRVYDGRVTYCQQEIPGEDRRAGLAPLMASLNVCKRCARMYQNAMDAQLEGRY